MKQFTFSAQVANNLLTVLQGYSKTIRLLLVMFLTLTVSANAWGADVSVTWPKTTALSTTATNVDGDANVTIKVSEANAYTSPLRFYAGKTTTIEVAEGYQLKSVAYEASSTGNYVTYAQNATVSPDVDPSVNDKIITWDLSSSNTKTFTFTPSSQTRCNGITITYTSGGGDPADPYTVTLVPGSGSVTNTELEEPNAGDGVTLPTPTLDCGDWEFAGWKTTSAVTTETTTEPTLIPAGAYSPTSDITLYAVYQRTETTSGGGGGSTEVTFNFGYTDWGKATSFSGTTYSTVEQNKNGVSVTYTRNEGSLYANTTSLRLYKTNTLKFDAGSNTITSIYFTGNIGQSDITTDAETCTNSTNTLSWAGSSKSVTFTRPDNASSYATLTSATLTIGGGSTTYYHSTPDCGVASTPTLTVNPTSLAFGNVATDSNKELDFTLTGSNLTANATLALSGTNESMFSVNPTSVTQSEGTIDSQNITVTYTPTAAGEHTATLTISSTGAENKTVTLSGTGVAPAAKYTVTFDAGSGSCSTTSLQETSSGAGVTLPTASPSDACKEEGWTFAGWAEASVATETTTAPATLLAAGDTYNPTADCTLYAVYTQTKTTSGGSGDYELVTSAPTDWSGTYLIVDGTSKNCFNGSLTTLDATNNYNSVTISNNIVSSTATTDSYSVTISKSTTTGKYYIKTASGYYIGSDATDSSKNNELDASTTTKYDNSISISSNNVTIQGPDHILKFLYTSGQERFRFYKSTTTQNVRLPQLYKKTDGSTTTTYYHSTPSCVPTYSITYDFAGGTGSHCSNTSVPQGDPYTICDEAPTKEGHTFQGWSDGTSIYAAGATITPEDDITLTAQWQIKTYTVIWSVNGDTTEESYEHGETLNVPDPNDIPSCDGEKEFVGWTEDNTFTYHATTPPSDLFTEKTATVTADATYYAVFATQGEGSANFVLGESGTFKMYANVNGTNYYAQGGVSSSKITSTTEAANASDYTLTHKGSNQYTIQLGNAYIGHSGTSSTDLNTTETTWTIQEGVNGSWRIVSPVNTSRALAYRASTYKIFKAYSMTNVEAGDTEYYDIEFGGTSSGYSDYTTICQQIESIEVQNPQTEFYLTDDFTIGSGKVIATLSGGGTTDVTALATFSGYNMNVVGTYTVTVTYMGATATYEINVKPLDNAWVLTWNVSGKTNTGLGPRYVTKGSAIGTLPTPVVPDACAGKTFMGWTESNIVPSDGVGIVYITEETVPTDNTTYYAVFATVNNFCTQKPIDQIASGSKVVIVAVASLTDDGGAGKAISSRATDDTYNLQGDDVAIYDQTINTPHSTCIWTITKSGEKYIFTQDGKYLNGIIDGSYSNLKYNSTSDSWSLSDAASGMAMTYNMKSTNASTEYVEWYNGKFTIHNEVNTNGAFDMQFFVTANADGNADITDYTTGCAEYTITYYGFHGGYSTSCSSDGTIVLPVNSIHTIPDCEGLVINDHTNLGREFLNVWMTQPHGGHTFKPGDTFILTQDTTLYAQWKMETTSDVTTLPTDIEDLAGTDIYVYGGTTLNIQPGTTTINSLTLKGGLQADGSYKMPTVWVPEGATLVRNSNKINLDLIVNAKTYYPFAVPFAAKNNANVEYLDPVLAAASTYGTHFAIKTYDGARRAEVGEDKANNWVRVLREETLQPGVGYIITALTYPDKDTATIRIPMTVYNTWFQNGEQAAVNTTVRNTIAVTAHAGAAATEHQRHAGWNFVANPYLTSFAGGNVANDGGLDYINGELIIEGSYEYTDEDVPYVTVPAYDFAYYSQHKLSDVKLSPEWSFFVQVGTGGTMNFTTAGRQQAPASIAARNAEERPVKMDVDLILSDNHNSDQTGIIICDRYTDAYEIGRDLEKLFGSAYNLSVYTLMEDNTPLAFQALAIRSSMQVIPVGYRAPEQGEYTFRLNEATSSIDLLNEQYEQLVLVDYQTGELTNLLYTDYTFYSERTQSNSRFAIYAVPRQNAPTDLPNAIGSDEEVRKVIYNDHLYILRDGNVYNGMGQKM